MWFIVPIVALGAGLAYLYNSVTEEEKQAEASWQRKRQEVERTLDDHNRNIRNYLESNRSIYEYHKMVDYHYSSVQIANVAYDLMNNSKTSLRGINNLITKTNKHRSDLQKQIEAAKEEGNKNVLFEKIEEIKVVNAIRKTQFEERDTIKKQTEEFYQKVKELNNQTSNIKNKIKLNCGQKGRDWYERLEMRKKLRA
ncbi:MULTISPECIES: hypothetical protein [unclassified Acinetobacter]|uniref:hypothetical protein n=1 Tax=unclassified Acinetobacter TaxID=196816 RepID=UPI0015D2249D|nr:MULTISPECIES: hypothetical protein [unclassified Acinetobacter]